MSRPRKQTVDYFPHCTTHKKTIYILEQQFGNDGYAFWFKLLEVLGSTDGHSYDTNDPKNWFYLISRANVNDETGRSIMDMLSSLKAIDQELWGIGVVWCQNFVDNLTHLYSKRIEKPPERPVIGTGKPVSGDGNPQRKGKDRIGKDKKRERSRFTPPSLDQIKDYFLEKGLPDDVALFEAQKFVDHYESNGWKVGKNKMQRWKNAASGWVSRMGDYERQPRGGDGRPKTASQKRQQLARELLQEKLGAAGTSGKDNTLLEHKV